MTLESIYLHIKIPGYVADGKHYEDVEVTLSNGTTYTRRQLVGSDKEDNTPKQFSQTEKSEVIGILNNPTEPRLNVDYTRENYNKLFPEGKTETPIGDVKLGAHQFERLDLKKRTDCLGLLAQTLKHPTVIIDETDDQGRQTKVWIKSVIDENKNRYYIAVAPSIDGVDVVVSNGIREKKQIEEKIKKASIYYYKAEGGSQTARTGVNPLPSNNSISHDGWEVKSLRNLWQMLKGA